MRRLLVAALLLPAVAQAAGYSIANYVPRDMAMGDSLVAEQTGAGAVYRNPAALARLSGLNLTLAGALIGNGSEWTTNTGLTPSPVSTNLKLVPPVAFFASWSGKIADHGYGVGIGVNVPAGGNVTWPDGWPGRHAIQTVDRKLYAFHANVAGEIIPQIRLGGGIVYYRATEELTTYVSVPGPGGSTDALATIADAGGKVGFDVGLEVQPLLDLPLRFGVNFSSAVRMQLTGPLNLAVPPPLAPLFPNQDVTHELPYPSVLMIGASWRVIPELVLTAQYTWEGYSIYETDTFVGQSIDPSTGQPLTVAVQRRYADGSLFRVGAGWQVRPDVELRGGLFYDASGVNPAFFNPSLPDAKKIVGTVGAGWEVMENLSIDAGFLYSWFLPLDSVPAESTATIDNSSSFPGTYKAWAWIASLGINYRWDPQGKQ